MPTKVLGIRLANYQALSPCCCWSYSAYTLVLMQRGPSSGSGLWEQPPQAPAQTLAPL